MSQPRWFYRDDGEWIALVERLKLMPCPHCKAVGTLIRHGSLHGFDDAHPREKSSVLGGSFAATATDDRGAAEPSVSFSPRKCDVRA